MRTAIMVVTAWTGLSVTLAGGLSATAQETSTQETTVRETAGTGAAAVDTAVLATARVGAPTRQTSTHANYTCWRGAPPPACHGFFLVEAQGVFPLVSSTRPAPAPGTAYGRVSYFESRLEWNLGYMFNVAEEWALGGTVSLGSGSYDALTGLRLRARRWLGPQLSVELGAGSILTHGNNLAGGVTHGISVDARFNVADRGSLFVRWDAIGVPENPFSFDPSGYADEGGARHALLVGVGAGSTYAVVGTALMGLGLLLLLSSVDFS